MAVRELPQTLGRYELLLRIGSGGMAAVYLARARGVAGFQREVAVKIIHPHLSDESEFVQGLLQEARIAARIRHPNVVPVLDVGEEGSGAYLVMDYVEGDVLSAMARRERSAGKRVPSPIALRILCDALAGLHAAHELRDDGGELLQIIHRDFSPQNILVGIDGVARLTDFGVARVASLSSSTRSGLVKGKLGYMAPEQVRHPRSIDRRTDVWAAGVVAWELVTGQPLHAREEEAAMLLRIVSETPPRARSVQPDVPPAIDDAIAAALQMDVAERIATADELRRRLLDAGLPVATAEEVGAYVKAQADPKLKERRELAMAAVVEPKTATRLTATGTVTVPLPLPLPRPRRARFVSVVALGVGAAGVVTVATLAGSARKTPSATVVSAPTEKASAAATAPAESTQPAASAAASSEPAPAATTMEAGPPVRAVHAPPARRAPPLPPRPTVTNATPPPGRPALPSDPLDDAR